jgi:hypothetical protein
LGTPQGSGSDSSTLAQRDVTAADIVADAIGSSEIGNNAIGPTEVADSTIDSLTFKTDAITSRAISFSAITANDIGSDAIGSLELSTDAVLEIWGTSQTGGTWNNGSFGKFLDTTISSRSSSAGSGLDSATTSRILGRKIFGIAAGSGSDSTTLILRKVTTWGGFVDSNKTEQGGIAGANRTWNVYVFDTSGTDTPIPSANVDVQLTNGTVKLRGTTVSSGLVTFTVTDGSWVLVSQETGYVLNNLSKTISGNSTDTVKGFDIQVGTPSSPALCRVFGYVYSVGAIPDDGAGVAAFLPSGVARSGNLIISPFSVSTISDSLGYFFLDLIRSDSLIPSGTMYDFIINRKDGTIVHKRVTVPNQSSWLLQW